MPEENVNTSPVEPMEPKVEATVESISPEEPKVPKKKSNALAIILLVILAVLGIGFGVYGMFFFNASENFAVECPKCDCPSCAENETECSKCEECESCSESEAISADYIYLPELGIKIKKPKEEEIFAFSYMSFASGYDYYFWATVKYPDHMGAGAFDVRIITEIGTPPYLSRLYSATSAESIDGNQLCSRTGGEYIMNLETLSDIHGVLCYKENEKILEYSGYDSEDLEYDIKPTLEKLKNFFTNTSNYSAI